MNTKINDRLTSFYEQYQQNNKELFENDLFSQHLYQALLSGDKTVFYKHVLETKVFDEKWIETLESYFPSIDKIMRNPKSGLMYEDEILPIEKVRKIGSQSIRHLSAHTHLIKEIDDGLVKPSKLLTTQAEIDYATYENRMVGSLIDRLFYFVRSRHEIIKEHAHSFQNKSLSFTADFPLEDAKLSLDLKLNIQEDPDDKEINRYNDDLLKRVKRLETMVNGFKRSPLMVALNNFQKVRTPIMKTSVIMKNPDYKNCYMLWLFLDRYNTLAFDTEVKETDMKMDGAYLEDVYRDVVVNLSTILYYQEQRRKEYNTFKEIKRKRSLKVIKDLDVNPLLDEEFVLEDQYINQFYLEQNKRLFEQALEYHEAESGSHEVALKKALQETIEFSNQLYYDFFEFYKEDDYFNKLLQVSSPDEELEKVKELAKIAKAIREVKEEDYRRSVLLEKRLLERIASLDDVLIEKADYRILSLVEMEKEEQRLINEKEQSMLAAQFLEEELMLSKQYQEELDELAFNTEQRLSDLAYEFEEKEKTALEQAIEEEQDIHDQAIRDLEEEHQQKMDDLNRNREAKIASLEHQYLEARRAYVEELQQTALNQRLATREKLRMGLDEKKAHYQDLQQQLKNNNQHLIDQRISLLEQRQKNFMDRELPHPEAISHKKYHNRKMKFKA